MKIMNYTAHLVGVALVLFTGLAHAAVARPALDIQNLTGDAGASLTASDFNIDATAFTIVTTGAPIDIPDQMFTLDSTSGSFNGASGSFGGIFSVDGGLLSGAYTDLLVFVNPVTQQTQFLGDVTYTGGSLAGSLTGGRIEGVLSGRDVVAKLGPVVPVPAAVWLFGSGLIGLVALARRKAA